MLQWLRLHTANAGDAGSIPGQGARSHKSQLTVSMLHLKIPRVVMKMEDLLYTTKTQRSQRKANKKHKLLLYSTGNYIQCLVINHNGKEYKKEYTLWGHD